MTRPWPPGAATGIGSLPGIDPVEAARLVFGELPDLPHVPELPDRGVGADMVGRTAALLVDLPTEIAASGWRITARPGRDLRRARDLLAWDVDALEAAGQGYTGAVKVQVTGPWTLATAIELASGHAVVSDPGAARDLADSLAEGVRGHVADIAGRLPGARVVVQVDEPAIDAVLGGRVPTPSGYGTVRSVSAGIVEQGLRTVLQAVPEGGRVVHCCANRVPFAVLRGAGADALSIDASTLTVGAYDEVGAAIDAGLALWLGVVPSSGTAPDSAAARAVIDELWADLGFAFEQRANVVVPTPACGLAGATPSYARAAMKLVREVGASLLVDDS
jgi:methionine synthase II (cobalamin-independent)